MEDDTIAEEPMDVASDQEQTTESSNFKRKRSNRGSKGIFASLREVLRGKDKQNNSKQKPNKSLKQKPEKPLDKMKQKELIQIIHTQRAQIEELERSKGVKEILVDGIQRIGHKCNILIGDHGTINSGAEEHILIDIENAIDDLKVDNRILEETVKSADLKLDTLLFYFENLSQKLKKDHKTAAKQLKQYFGDLEDNLNELKQKLDTTAQMRNPIIETESEIFDEGVKSLRRVEIEPEDVTSSSLPAYAKPLHQRIFLRYGRVPVDLEKLLCGLEKAKGFYFGDGVSYEDKIAKWLLQWVRRSPENSGEVLQKQLQKLDQEDENKSLRRSKRRSQKLQFSEPND